MRKDAKKYDDKHDYTIFDEVRDKGDIGVTQRSSFPGLFVKYQGRMETFKKQKIAVIDNYYDRQKDQNTELTELLDTIEVLETKHLPVVLKDGSAVAYYKYNDQQNGRIVAKMPADYADYAKKVKVYPSQRMFDTMSVWSDIFKGRLGDMTMLQWIIIALICDLVSFVLFALFRDYDTI